MSFDTFRDIIYSSNIAEDRLSFNTVLEDIFYKKSRVISGVAAAAPPSSAVPHSAQSRSKLSTPVDAADPHSSDLPVLILFLLNICSLIALL